MGAIDAALSDLVTDASGNGAQFLAGDGTFKAAGGAVQSVRVTLTSAQLLALHTSPVTIVAAPGAGLAVEPVFASCTLNYGSAAYNDSASSNSTGLYYSGDASGIKDLDNNVVTNAVTQASSNFGFVGCGNGGLPQSYANEALVLFSPTGNMTTGNGTATLTVFYATVTL